MWQLLHVGVVLKRGFLRSAWMNGPIRVRRMAYYILVALSVAAVANILLMFPLIAMMSGGSQGAAVVFALLLVAPVLAAAGWIIYGAQAVQGPAGWGVGLVLALRVAFAPKFILAPSADRAAAAFQEADRPLSVITPEAIIAVTAKEYGGAPICCAHQTGSGCTFVV
jgi:hypothetical protein